MPSEDLTPTKEIKLPEFILQDKPCPDCGGSNLYANGICVPCHEEKERSERLETGHYTAMLSKLPPKLREVEMKDLDMSPGVIKMKYLIKQAGDKRESVYFHGSIGNGKTSLMALYFKHLVRKGVFVDWANVPELMEQIRRSYGKQDDLVGRLISTGAHGTLFLDDLGAERVKQDAEVTFVEEQLYRLINGLYERNGHVMIISNKWPGEIAGHVGDRIASRLVEMCVQVENNLPDYRLKKVRKT